MQIKRKIGALEGAYKFYSPIQGHLNQSITFYIGFFFTAFKYKLLRCLSRNSLIVKISLPSSVPPLSKSYS